MICLLCCMGMFVIGGSLEGEALGVGAVIFSLQYLTVVCVVRGVLVVSTPLFKDLI